MALAGLAVVPVALIAPTALSGAGDAWAVPSDGSYPSQVTLPGPTTTAVASSNASPTTQPQTASASTTTTTKAKSTTSTTVKGVPSVPVGGPPTTTAPKGKPPPPPPNPDPILSQVQADLAQLTAIGDFKPAQAQVAASQRALTLAGAELQSAEKVLNTARQVQQIAQARAQTADDQLRNLAIAAYTGLAYATPAAGPQGLGSDSIGTVSTPGGLTGIEALDAREMLILVGKHARRNVADSGHALSAAKKATKRAQAAYDRAQGVVANAEAGLLASQQTLKIVIQAATTPGAAATIELLSIPGASAGGLLPGAAKGLGIPGLTPTPTVGPNAITPPTRPGTSTTTTVAPTTTTIASLAAVAQATGQLNGLVSAAINLPPPASPSILGQSVMTGAELAGWFASTNHKANTTVPIQKLAAAYQAAGQSTGVRYDLAFAQSIVETGYFSFPSYGQLTPKDNNFAGIGACDTCAHGWSFPDAQRGVGAQMELLEAYASIKPVKTPLLPGAVGVGGCCSSWIKLAGTWASSLTYGISIMTVYDKMLTWVIPQRLLAVGLIAPTASVVRGPSLAPLPGATPALAAKPLPAH